MANRVLIADDNSAMRIALREMLPGGKFEVVEAVDGKAALATIKEEHENLRLIILKYALPQIEGWKILHKAQMHPKLQNIPMVLVATEKDPVTQKLADVLDYCAVVTPPFERKTFQKAIKAAIANAQRPRTPQDQPKAHKAQPKAHKAPTPQANPDNTATLISAHPEPAPVSPPPPVVAPEPESIPVPDNGVHPVHSPLEFLPPGTPIPYEFFDCVQTNGNRRQAYGIQDIAMSPDGLTFYTCGENSYISRWELATLSKIEQFNLYSKGAHCITVSPNGSTVISGAHNSNIKLWNIMTGELLDTLSDQSMGINSLAMTPDGQIIISSSAHSNIKLWDFTTGELLGPFNDQSMAVTSVVISSDGSTVFTGSHDSNIKFWDFATGELLGPLNVKSFRVTTIALTPDNQCIVSGDEQGMINITRLDTGENLRTLKAHQTAVNGVAVSPDGWWIVSASDTEIKLWGIAE
ncbi:response regulator [Spirulina subsalsa FACHB-351]|uniref:Response regulator n=1 Tax=Spirulina subsalsa FACHB-351 TaxID=234711 RepID=A0ABT3L3T6_9CYAN|nr:response regulator [Spirulina subsalsa]MCW6036176.1 response regulator [Spirulina subsalsa FACHB-351]